MVRHLRYPLSLLSPFPCCEIQFSSFYSPPKSCLASHPSPHPRQVPRSACSHQHRDRGHGSGHAAASSLVAAPAAAPAHASTTASTPALILVRKPVRNQITLSCIFITTTSGAVQNTTLQSHKCLLEVQPVPARCTYSISCGKSVLLGL
ncbi:MAG: hypothetical protein CHKLHMKO_00446 [Candidatus Argoarchaeum ethanivorans]|uniref:Uncharacterized protein n=1 Tax=Candidatus Argoarchaeum ethanivorans TaxID=2608793 RepID=A0A811T7B3_9EURY|nr:MAG: hypothetical protein CHKLHMKO_00446 [Candidatus Argoarchaeum ethanivorans]